MNDADVLKNAAHAVDLIEKNKVHISKEERTLLYKQEKKIINI